MACWTGLSNIRGRDHFWSEASVFSHQIRPVMACGVGLTPIVSMLEVLAEQHHNVPIFYVHGTSSPEHHALDAQVRKAAARHGNVLVETFYESGADKQANPAGSPSTGCRQTPLWTKRMSICAVRVRSCATLSAACAMRASLRIASTTSSSAQPTNNWQPEERGMMPWISAQR